MATPTSPPPSFSPRRKWNIAFSVVFATIAVFAILVGVNYLSSRYFFKRFYLSSDTRVKLSPRTISVLKALTNQVEVTIYYDKDNPLYGDIVSLLREYQSHTRKLTFKTVDYFRDPGAAAEMKAKYKMGSATNKDFIIFDSDGRTGYVDNSWLAPYRDEMDGNTVQRRHPVFNGEMLFTAKLFAVTQPKPLTAYFLQGHGEHSPTDKEQDSGYGKLAEVFHRNYVNTSALDLLSTNTIPQDCNLLVIAGPTSQFHMSELDKISKYLEQGGRLLALFNVYSATNRPLGLESVLANWNVRVTHSIVLDQGCAVDQDKTGSAFSVTNYSRPPHAIMNPIMGSPLEIVLPRPIERIKAPSQTSADEPQVTELAFSSTGSVLRDNSAPRSYPLMVAVEKGAAKGVVTERGTTRMLIMGDSLMLDNQLIDFEVNQDFADSAVNWLLERATWLQGVSPRPITDYRLLLNSGQVNAVKGILLGAIPGGILLFGGLVWLRRRK